MGQVPAQYLYLTVWKVSVQLRKNYKNTKQAPLEKDTINNPLSHNTFIPRSY